MPVSTAVDASARARVLGIKPEYRDLSGGAARFLPIRIAVIGQGATAETYATDKKQVFSANEVGDEFGYGSPLHLAVEQLLPLNGDGVGTIPVTVYPLEDDASGVAAAGDITPSVGTITQAAYNVRIAGIDSLPFTVEVGDAVADIIDKMVTAINGVPSMPMIASDGTTTLDLDAKWEGASGNDLEVEVIGPTDAGVTWAFTQPTGGLNNPVLTGAIAQIGNIWETFILNCLDVADTTALDALQTEGDGRWGALVRKPFVSFVGNTIVSQSSAVAVSDARKSDKINSQLVAPGSHNLPCVVAARELARIAAIANNNPPQDYAAQKADGLRPGLDSEQWSYTERDAAFKAGSSSVEVIDDIVTLSDTVTFYHPTGDPLPAYQYVVDLVKLWNVIYNLDLIFTAAEWAGAPLIPDDQPTTNPTAKKPKMAKAAIAQLIDSLALNAIISDPKAAKESIVAAINETNPKRLDVALTVKLSGNTSIISVDLFFGFFFGSAPIVG